MRRKSAQEVEKSLNKKDTKFILKAIYKEKKIMVVVVDEGEKK